MWLALVSLAAALDLSELDAAIVRSRVPVALPVTMIGREVADVEDPARDPLVSEAVTLMAWAQAEIDGAIALDLPWGWGPQAR